MTSERPAVLRFVILFALLLPLLSLPAWADDDEADVEHVTWQLQVRPWPAPPAVPGPTLMLPTDAGEEPPYAPFQRPASTYISFDEEGFSGYVPSIEMVLEMLVTSPLYLHIDEGELEIEARDPRTLYFRGTPTAIRKAKAIVHWMIKAGLPSIEARATLTSGGDGPALLASGATRLEPGVWTGLYRVRNDTPLAVDWEIEIAQESTAMVPLVLPVPEGQELYLRYHPGESVSLVEVWSGTLEHLEVFEVDLSVIRNVPEASGSGKLQLPQTAGYRTYTVLALPTDGASRHELTWDGPARPVRLVLDFQPPKASPPAQVAEQLTYAIHRVGAVAAGLEFDRRRGSVEEFIDSIRRGFEGEEDISSVSQGVLSFRGPERSAGLVRSALAAAEALLRNERVRLRVLRFTEGSVRRALEAGRVAVGAELAPEAMGALSDEGGSVAGPSLVTPVLAGIETSIRVGKSVTGLSSLDVEVAQQAGGTDPVMGARFDGLAGNVILGRTAAGFDLDVHLRFEWANPEAGRIELVHRAPMSMYGDRSEYPPATSSDRVTLPVLGGGSAVIANTLHLPDRGREVLGGIVVRGTEAHLLMVSLLP